MRVVFMLYVWTDEYILKHLLCEQVLVKNESWSTTIENFLRHLAQKALKVVFVPPLPPAVVFVKSVENSYVVVAF